MAKRIAIASTKGGVGKTTTAITLGHALTQFGREIIVVDADLQRPHVGVILGYEHTPHSTHSVLEGEHSIHDATYVHPSGLRILPGDINAKHIEEHSHLFDALTDMHSKFEAIIIDTPPASPKKLKELFAHVDHVLVITTPDTSSLVEAKKTIQAAKDAHTDVLGVIVTKHKEHEHGVAIKNIEMELQQPIIGVIPYAKDIQQAHAHKYPVTHTHTEIPVSVAYKKLAANIIGEKYVNNLEKNEPEEIEKTVLKRLGFSR